MLEGMFRKMCLAALLSLGTCLLAQNPTPSLTNPATNSRQETEQERITELRGKLEQARKGNDPMAVAQALDDLSLFTEPEESLRLLNECLAIREKAVGPNAGPVLQTLGYLVATAIHYADTHNGQVPPESMATADRLVIATQEVVKKDASAAAKHNLDIGEQLKQALQLEKTHPGPPPEVRDEAALAAKPALTDAQGSKLMPATPLKECTPRVSQLVRRIGRGGEIAAIVYVDSNGKPERLKMIETIGFGIEQYVAACASEMTFLPATKDGTPVEGQYTLRLTLHVAN